MKYILLALKVVLVRGQYIRFDIDMLCPIPAGTQRQNDVVLMLMRHDGLVSASIRCHLDVKFLLGLIRLALVSCCFRGHNKSVFL